MQGNDKMGITVWIRIFRPPTVDGSELVSRAPTSGKPRVPLTGGGLGRTLVGVTEVGAGQAKRHPLETEPPDPCWNKRFKNTTTGNADEKP